MNKSFTRRQALARIGGGFVAGAAGLLLPKMAQATDNAWSVVGTTTWSTPPWGWATAPVSNDTLAGSDYYYGAANVTAGNRLGVNCRAWVSNWHDQPYAGSFAPRVDIDLRTPQSPNEIIDTVSVYTIQDDYQNPVDPSDTMTCSLYGIRDFEVWGMNTSGYLELLGSVYGTNLVKNTIHFQPIAVSAVRVRVLRSMWGYSMITAIEVQNVSGTTSTISRDVALAAAQVFNSGDNFVLPTYAAAQNLQAYMQDQAAVIANSRTTPGPTQTFNIHPKSIIWTSDTGNNFFEGPSLDFTGAENSFYGAAQNIGGLPSGAVASINLFGIPLSQPLTPIAVPFRVTPTIETWVSVANEDAIPMMIGDEWAAGIAYASRFSAALFTGQLIGLTAGTIFGSFYYNNVLAPISPSQWFSQMTRDIAPGVGMISPGAGAVFFHQRSQP